MSTDAPAFKPKPVPANVVEMAREAVRDFHECFWFRHPDATIVDWDDVRLIIEHLRNYGGHLAWQRAQSLHKCH